MSAEIKIVLYSRDDLQWARVEVGAYPINNLLTMFVNTHAFKIQISLYNHMHPQSIPPFAKGNTPTVLRNTSRIKDLSEKPQA